MKRVTHGDSGYRRGCRCETCRQGHAAKARDFAARNRNTCEADDCDRIVYAGGLCRTHHGRRSQAPRCSEADCDRPMHARTLCRQHWQQWREGILARSCAIGDCDNKIIGAHVCDDCVARWERVNAQWDQPAGKWSAWWEPERPTPCTVLTAGDVWFSEDTRKAAAHLCGLCPVQAECLAAAQATRATCGTWAGKWFGGAA